MILSKTTLAATMSATVLWLAPIQGDGHNPAHGRSGADPAALPATVTHDQTLYAQQDPNAENKRIIKVACGFTSAGAENFWRVIDTHPHKNSLYQNLATNMTKALIKSWGGDSAEGRRVIQALIQARLQFTDSQAAPLWHLIENAHDKPKDLYQVLVLSLVGIRDKVRYEVKYDVSDEQAATCQRQIQAVCKFSNPGNVWNAFNGYPGRMDLYNTLARELSASKPPSRLACQRMIQAICNFSNRVDVWIALDKHANADELYRIIAKGLVPDWYGEKNM